MLDDGRQLCDHCEYDITGIGRAGHLVRCPECGGENRIGATNPDLLRPAVPPWWYMALSFGWPSVLWLPFGLAALNTGVPAMVKSAVILGAVVLAVAAARGLSLALDCAVPGKRWPIAAWVISMALVGAVTVPVVLVALISGGLWVVAWLNRLNGTPL